MVLRQLLKRWKQYRYRFVPWIVMNLKERSVRNVLKGEQDKLTSDEKVSQTLVDFFTVLSKCTTSQHHDGDSLYKALMKQQYGDSEIAKRNMGLMREMLGFSIKRSKSKVAGGGVCVHQGCIKQGAVLAFYPGTIYHPDEPILIQSLRNPFVFRCIDSILIDGNDKGISKLIYRSCCQRERIGAYFSCDMSWLTEHPANPMAVGQYINNRNKKNPANVSYQEFDVPEDFPFHLRQFIPNVYYTSSSDYTFNRLTRTVVLVALRDIKQGEELFSNYFTVVH